MPDLSREVDLIPTDLEPDAGRQIVASEDVPEPLEELVVTEAPPPPLGRSWAFQFPAGRFFVTPGQGPLPTYGTHTLSTWIEKCLRTERGSHPIHPPDYGVPGLSEVFGRQHDQAVADLPRKVTEALLFHPRIEEVTDIDVQYEPGDESIAVTMTVILDDEDELDLSVDLT